MYDDNVFSMSYMCKGADWPKMVKALTSVMLMVVVMAMMVVVMVMIMMMHVALVQSG